MKGLDGIQGPMYVGTGCVFHRQALYGYSPPSLPTINKSSSTCSWLCCCGRSSKASSKEDEAEIRRQSKQEDLNAAIYNLREIESMLL